MEYKFYTRIESGKLLSIVEYLGVYYYIDTREITRGIDLQPMSLRMKDKYKTFRII